MHTSQPGNEPERNDLNEPANSPSFTDDWDSYWRGTQEAALPSSGGAQDKALSVFWTKFFREEFPRHEKPRLLDTACGNGAVTGFALQVAKSIESVELTVSCMDYSKSAIEALEQKYPGVQGVTCDASETPFADGDFDIVASQFGLDYAGAAAFDEAARLVSKDGVLVAVVHMKSGAIFEECADNLAAIRTLQESQLLSLARDAFDAGLAVVAGNAPQTRFRDADKKFAPAVESLKKTLTKHGPLAAGGMIFRLGKDLGMMYQRIEAYVPQEVSDWLDRMGVELAAYAGRMQSMVNAAFDETDMKELSSRLRSKGLTVDTYDKMKMGKAKAPAAWILVGRRLG
jgi:ubiquinone/menaquinone biosynthesis C-methylase UbiE